MSDLLKELETTEKRLHESLKEINSRPEFNATAIEILYKVVDELKDIATIRAMEESGYSNGYSYPRDRIMYGNAYRRSYGDNYTSNRQDEWSRNDKQSRIQQLRNMMESAADKREYEMYRNMIDQLEH